MISRDRGLDGVDIGLPRVALSIAREQHEAESSSARAMSATGRMHQKPSLMILSWVIHGCVTNGP
jgi:hypothetical protein